MNAFMTRLLSGRNPFWKLFFLSFRFAGGCLGNGLYECFVSRAFWCFFLFRRFGYSSFGGFNVCSGFWSLAYGAFFGNVGSGFLIGFFRRDFFSSRRFND